MTIKYPNGGIPKYQPTKPRKPAVHKKSAHVKEHDIQNNIIEALANKGHHVWRINVGSVEMKDGRRFHAGPQAGFPDVCGYRKQDGKMFFIEVKTATGKRRPAQEFFAKDIAYSPVIYGVCRSVEDALNIVSGGINRTEDVK